jgi:hypothetical protein
MPSRRFFHLVLFLAALVSSVALAQPNEGPYGTGNNGWCRAPPGKSCTTGRQTRRTPSVNVAPVLPPIGGGDPSKTGPNGLTKCLATLNPFTAFNPAINGLGNFVRNCVEQPAYADNPPFQLQNGTYDVGNKVFENSEPVTFFGTATITSNGGYYEAQMSALGNRILRLSQSQRQPPKQPGAFFQVLAHQTPSINPRVKPKWIPQSQPVMMLFVRRVNQTILEYDVYYTNRRPPETWVQK